MSAPYRRVSRASAGLGGFELAAVDPLDPVRVEIGDERDPRQVVATSCLSPMNAPVAPA